MPVPNDTITDSDAPQTFESAIDWWVLLMLLMGPVTAAGVGIVLVVNARPADASILFGLGALIALVTVGLVVPCRYTLLDDCLSIRCGLICYQIAYEDIRDVKISHSIMSGPALSLSRLEIKTSDRTHLISPKDRGDFMEELHHRCQV
ncbi:MAG: PH domain-containing protein [Planctomycetota bacterium]